MFKPLKSIKNLEFLMAIVIVLIGVGLRFLPHSPNFAPIGAIALFAGAYLSRKTALLLPLLAMVISDIFIGYYEIGLMVVVYTCFLIYVVLGFWLKQHKKWYTIIGTSIVGAVIFFVLTNLAVWVFASWYPKTLSGLTECYFQALPFFRNTLLGDLFYAFMFFGAYEIARVWIRKKITAKEINLVLSGK